MRRRVHPLRFLKLASLTALVGIPLAVACGEDATVPDPTAPETGAGEDSGSDSPVAADTSPTEDGGGEDAADVTCPDVAPNDAEGIFVTPTGMNTGTCGTRAAPCKTISFSVTRAGAAFRTKVFVAAGTYVEKVTLAAGVEVIGGWEVTGTTWKRACVTPEELVVVRAPALQNITVEAHDLNGEARLSLLHIESKAAVNLVAGESVYGVVATGTTTTLVLTDVNVAMGNAASGVSGPKGDAGAPGPASCAPGPAVVAEAGAPGAQGTGAPVGTYDPNAQYVPGTAMAGGVGTVGENGNAGGAAPPCLPCGTCVSDAMLMTCNFVLTPGQTSCGAAGKNGCGGGPGDPGGPAIGGGSDIGVFAWDATVTIKGGSVKSGDAGNGGTGGPGGAGGAGSAGVAGTMGDICTTSCLAAGAACTPVMTKGAGGTAGGTGALGGTGGSGGGGGGGSSFATYQGGQGVVSVMGGTTLSHGKPGKGGPPDAGAGASGVAADHVP